MLQCPHVKWEILDVLCTLHDTLQLSYTKQRRSLLCTSGLQQRCSPSWVLTVPVIICTWWLPLHLCQFICKWQIINHMLIDPTSYSWVPVSTSMAQQSAFHRLQVPRGAGSPPVPIMHSPPRPVSVKDQQDWKIPPSISNWKNPKGYTIPLDKRLAADGRGLQETAINDSFAKFTEALYMAESSARQASKFTTTLLSPPHQNQLACMTSK